ncbi:AIPR family protein [Ruegeria atlantica]|uniref:AIPR family protein n=1 Tax=Ruegeria atlantica TaxID=81569 RepID=UPI001479A89A|nr:AIPR family protein [Ruegeria atlantica]
MDPILDGYVSDYTKKAEISSSDQGKAFEHFANHCVIARDFPSLTNTQDIVVGGSNDTGIDGVAFFVNGIHIEDTTTIDYFANKTRISVDLVFIQSKSGPKVSASEVGTFCEGVYNFFKNTGMKESSEITELKKLVSHVFQKAASMARRPNIYMYYCTASNFKGDQNVDSRSRSGCERLKELDLFNQVNFEFLNKKKLTTRYDEIRLKIERTINFERHAAFPKIDGIRQAYIGLLKCEELVKLISNSDGELQRNLFSENIRDFLGENKVNKEIKNTITCQDSRTRLPALNNGITIVAKEVANVADQFTLRDYQIVNGCQTSNVIYLNKSHLNEDAFVPVKIVEVAEDELVNEIVKSTNRQTQVTDEAFVALEDFHKQLEKFFSNIHPENGQKLYYERRRNQYQEHAITQKQVVTLTLLTKSFVAIFKEEPHSTQRYYGELLDANKATMFIDGQSLWAYYAAAVIFYRIDKKLKQLKPAWLKKYRYQFCLLYYRSFGVSPEIQSHKKMQAHCSRLISETWVDEEFERRFNVCKRIITDAEKNEPKDHQGNPPYRRREFTRKILTEVESGI